MCVNAMYQTTYSILMLSTTIQLCEALSKLAMILDKRPNLCNWTLSSARVWTPCIKQHAMGPSCDLYATSGWDWRSTNPSLLTSTLQAEPPLPEIFVQLSKSLRHKDARRFDWRPATLFLLQPISKLAMGLDKHADLTRGERPSSSFATSKLTITLANKAQTTSRISSGS